MGPEGNNFSLLGDFLSTTYQYGYEDELRDAGVDPEFANEAMKYIADAVDKKLFGDQRGQAGPSGPGRPSATPAPGPNKAPNSPNRPTGRQKARAQGAQAEAPQSAPRRKPRRRKADHHVWI